MNYIILLQKQEQDVLTVIKQRLLKVKPGTMRNGQKVEVDHKISQHDTKDLTKANDIKNLRVVLRSTNRKKGIKSS